MVFPVVRCIVLNVLWVVLGLCCVSVSAQAQALKASKAIDTAKALVEEQTEDVDIGELPAEEILIPAEPADVPSEEQLVSPSQKTVPVTPASAPQAVAPAVPSQKAASVPSGVPKTEPVQEATPAPSAAQEVLTPEAVPVSSDPDSEKFDENLFFDAEALVPSGEVAKKSAPSKVDPVLNPASRLVIATRTRSADSKDARLVSAERAMKLGRTESALEIYESLYVSNKRDPNVLLGRAVALQTLARDDEAIAAYEELLAIRPKNPDAQINLAGLVGRRYPAVALQKLRKLYEDNPGSTAIVAQMAVVEAKMGRTGDALKTLGMAASMEPQNASHIFNMAVIADHAGDKKSAVKYYEEALEIDTLYGAGQSIPRDSVFARLAQLR